MRTASGRFFGAAAAVSLRACTVPAISCWKTLSRNSPWC